MHQCDLSLNADSEAELQYIVSSYALVWRYKFNAQMSSVIDIGESPLSRRLARPKRCWYIQRTPIPERDEQKHLGILHSFFQYCSTPCWTLLSWEVCFLCHWIQIWMSAPVNILPLVLLIMHSDYAVWMWTLVTNQGRNWYSRVCLRFYAQSKVYQPIVIRLQFFR